MNRTRFPRALPDFPGAFARFGADFGEKFVGVNDAAGVLVIERPVERRMQPSSLCVVELVAAQASVSTQNRPVVSS